MTNAQLKRLFELAGGAVVGFGLLTQVDLEQLQEHISAIVGAAVALYLAASAGYAWFAEHWWGPVQPPTPDPGRGHPRVLPLVLLAVLLMPGISLAQTRSADPVQCCWGRIRYLEQEIARLRAERQQSPTPQTDPALLAAIQSLRDQNTQLIALLTARQQQPAQPQTLPPLLHPQIIERHYYQSPQQQLPIQGSPQQQLPIQGSPQQQLPIQGSPQQQLPIQGKPQQQLPQQGSPQQQLPLGKPPETPTPINPIPYVGTPQGYQRYTHAIAPPCECGPGCDCGPGCRCPNCPNRLPKK